MADFDGRARRKGRALNTTKYTGVQALSPFDFYSYTRDPINGLVIGVDFIRGDYRSYFVGDEWLNRATGDLFKLIHKDSKTYGTWVLIDNTAGLATNLRDDLGTLIVPAAAAISFSGGNKIYTASAANTIITNLDDRLTTNGQILIAATGGNAEWRTLTAGVNVGITWVIPNSIVLSSAVGGNLSIMGDISVATSLAGAINIIGGDNINTAGDAAQTLSIHLNQSILQPNTNATGTQGLYSLGGTDFVSNYNGNVFLGGAGNRTITGTNNVAVGNLASSSLTTGSYNTNLTDSLFGDYTTGNYNVGVGEAGGTLIADGSSNIDINHDGVASENRTLRIGTSANPNLALSAVYIDGIYQEDIDRTSMEVLVADDVDKLATISIPDLRELLDLYGNIVKIASGQSFTLLLLSDGSVWGAGRNYSGALGLGDNIDRYFFTRMSGIGSSGCSDIAAGQAYSVILKNGAAYSCGLGKYNHSNPGWLGTGTALSTNVPTPMIGHGTSGVTAVAAGYTHTAVLKGDAVYTTGNNMAWINPTVSGKLGIGTTAIRYVLELTPMVGEGASGCNAIACGTHHTVVLKGDAAFACGSSQVTVGTSGCTGDGTKQLRTQLVPMIGHGTSGVTSIAAGGFFSLVLKGDAVFGTGKNNYGQLGLGYADPYKLQLTAAIAEGASGVDAFSAGSSRSHIMKGGAIYGTGKNDYGQLGDGTTTERNRFTPAINNGSSGFSKLFVGSRSDFHTPGLRGDTIYTTGLNSFGVFGNGTIISSTLFTSSIKTW